VLNPGDLEGSLYGHYVGHSIGIGRFFSCSSPLVVLSNTLHEYRFARINLFRPKFPVRTLKAFHAQSPQMWTDPHCAIDRLQEGMVITIEPGPSVFL
jgi:hypothetical protein